MKDLLNFSGVGGSQMPAFPGPTSYSHSISLSGSLWRTEAFLGANLCPSIPCLQGSDEDVWRSLALLGGKPTHAHIDFPEPLGIQGILRDMVPMCRSAG